MAAMDGMLVAGVFALLLAHGVVSAWRWWATMRLQGKVLRFSLVLRLFFVGMRQGKIRLNGNIKGLLWFRTVSEYLVPGGVQIWRPRAKARREDRPRSH